MKKIYYLLLCVVSVFSVSAQTNCNLPSNLQNGLLAYYPFGGGGTSDTSGNSRHLVNTSTAHTTTDRNGNANCAFQFNNLPTGNEFLTFSSPTFLNNLNEMSISLWYMPEDPNRGNGAYEALISRDVQLKCPDRYGEWSIGLYDCRRAVFGRQDSVWEIPNSNGCNVASNTGTWKYLVATYDLSIPSMKIFIDGVLQDSSIQGANCGIVPVVVQDIGDLFVGKDYTGKIDDIFIYNRAITPNDIIMLYNLGSSCCTGSLAVNKTSENMKMTIYPNPVDGILNISGLENEIGTTIVIYNTLSQAVLTTQNTGNSVDVSLLPTGNYIITISSETKNSSIKFFKK